MSGDTPMMAMPASGERPNRFQLDADGDWLYIGSEVCARQECVLCTIHQQVGAYLKLFRGTLYKKYPQLWKRAATYEDKKKLQDLSGF